MIVSVVGNSILNKHNIQYNETQPIPLYMTGLKPIAANWAPRLLSAVQVHIAGVTENSNCPRTT